jgi:hypothetical protein
LSNDASKRAYRRIILQRATDINRALFGLDDQSS